MKKIGVTTFLIIGLIFLSGCSRITIEAREIDKGIQVTTSTEYVDGLVYLCKIDPGECNSPESCQTCDRSKVCRLALEGDTATCVLPAADKNTFKVCIDVDNDGSYEECGNIK
jgi:hypothetical protein